MKTHITNIFSESVERKIEQEDIYNSITNDKDKQKYDTYRKINSGTFDDSDHLINEDGVLWHDAPKQGQLMANFNTFYMVDVEVKDIKVKYLFGDKEAYYVKTEEYMTNGVRKDATFMFLADDPQIIWEYGRDDVPETIVIEGKFVKDLAPSDIIKMAKSIKTTPSFIRRSINKLCRWFRK